MDQIEQRVRAEHPDWNDEQVATEVARLKAEQQPPPPKPDDQDRDAAMARMRREKEAAERRAQEAEDKLAAEERKKAEQQGEWQKLAEQYESERDQARQETADLRKEFDDFKARIEVEKIARRLKFRNDDEALALVKVNNPDLDLSDRAAAEAALTRLADERKHLIDTGAPPPGGRPTGDPPAGSLTREQVEAMTPAELEARWDEVQAFLASQT